MEMTIGIQTHIDACHWLPDYNGPCATTHGHTWTIDVEVTGEVDEKTGMVMDLRELKQIVNDIVQPLDHNVLNSRYDNPTCETLVADISERIFNILYDKYPTGHPLIVTVTIREGLGGWARFTRTW